MKLIDDIRERIGMIFLNKELSSLERNVYIQNFHSANIIGFIFDADDEDKYKESCNFMDFIQSKNIEVYGLGITTKNEQKISKPNIENIAYFCLKNVNWYKKPFDAEVTNFIERKHDILIDFSMMDIFELRYIFASSKSTFKITNQSTKDECADFVIEVNSAESLNNYEKHIIHYLNSIIVE